MAAPELPVNAPLPPDQPAPAEYDQVLPPSNEDQVPELDPSTPLSLRALVSSKEAGIIIGRGGQHVADLRAATGVKAGVSKVVPRVHRVLTLSGTLESVAHAFELIAQSFLDIAPQTPHAYSPTGTSVPTPGNAEPNLAASPVPAEVAESGLPGERSPATSTPASSAPAVPGAPFETETGHGNTSGSSPSAEVTSLVGSDTSLGGNAATIRLLICHALMGAIIGKQGVTIKAIQEESGAKMVASKEMLPNSTERVIDITGSPLSVRKAVTDVGKYVARDWDRAHGTVLYDPDPADGVAALAAGEMPMSTLDEIQGDGRRLRKGRASDRPTQGYPSFVAAAGPGLASVPHALPNNMSGGIDLLATAATVPYAAHVASLQHQRIFAPTGVPAGSATFPAAVATAASQGAAVAPGGGFVTGGVTGQGPTTAPRVIDAANMRTQNISIPADMVGCIIGKAGSKITEIRRLSGSRISIAKFAHDETGERLFTIQGTPASNEKALYLLNNQVRSSYSCALPRRKMSLFPASPVPFLHADTQFDLHFVMCWDFYNSLKRKKSGGKRRLMPRMGNHERLVTECWALRALHSRKNSALNLVTRQLKFKFTSVGTLSLSIRPQLLSPCLCI